MRKNSISDYEIKYNENKVVIDKYLPEELKNIYSDINNNNYTKDDIDRKLVDFYAKSNFNHLKEQKENKIEEGKKKNATILNNYEADGWGNAELKLYEQKGSAEFN